MSSLETGKPSLVVLDFDGVLTDNRILVMEDGREGVMCNRSDGIGVRMLKNAGIDVLILSTEVNKVVQARADKLKVSVLKAVENKALTLTDYCLSKKIDLHNVMYVGNDVNDVEVMKITGTPVAVADAHERVKAVAVKVTKRCGGGGVVQEIAENFLNLEYCDGGSWL